MSELLVTQCPHCQTRFRLTPEQLSVANGHVRCGACLEVFHAADAAAALSRQPQPTPATSEPTPPPAPAPTPPAQTSLLPDDLDEVFDEDLPQELDEPDLAALGLDESIISEVNPSGLNELPATDQPDGLADLHEDFLATPPAQDFGPDFDHQRSERYRPLTADDGYTDQGIFQRDNPGTGAPLPTEADSPGEAEAEPTSAALPEPGEAVSAPEPEHQPAAPAEPEPGEPQTQEELPIGPDAEDRLEPSVTPLQLEILEEELLGLENQRRRPPSWLWSSLALLALLALPAQYLYYNFDALAHDQRSRPLLENLCLLARCELPARVDISRIRSANLLVRAHPEFPNALAIDVILYNRADFEQPFPVLEMQFTDASGRRLASRRFRPEEYLSGELAGVHLMPPQTPIHVGLSMLDPGPQARNYQLEFLSP